MNEQQKQTNTTLFLARKNRTATIIHHRHCILTTTKIDVNFATTTSTTTLCLHNPNDETINNNI